MDSKLKRKFVIIWFGWYFNDLICIPAVLAFIYWRKQEVIISQLNQGTESSVQTKINKDTRGTFNQVYNWVVFHDFMIV